MKNERNINMKNQDYDLKSSIFSEQEKLFSVILRLEHQDHIETFRHTTFNTIHNLTHPGIKAMIKLISQRLFGRQWERVVEIGLADNAYNVNICIAKITQHVTAPLGTFTKP